MGRGGLSRLAMALAFAVLLAAWGQIARAGEKSFSALVLNSYHQGFPWTDGILEGIMKTFSEKGLRVNLSIEFMDTKRTTSSRTMSVFLNYFKEKYLGKTFDIILCSDDDAAAFLFRRGKNLFPGTPVVFCGLNNPGLLDFEGAPPFTGVLEQVDISGTADLILRLFPETKNLALVSDLSPSGMSVISQARKDLAPYRDRIAVTDIFGLHGEELREAVSRLPPDTAVLVLVCFQDAGGEFYSPARTAALLRSAGPFPVFGLWSMMIEGGCLGGSVLVPEEHGATAAGMAARILLGESPGAIPPARDNHLVPMFNHGEMARFGLGALTIPGGSIIVGEPETFFYKYRVFILLNGAVASAALIYIFALFINERMTRAAEKRMRLKVAQWEGLFQNAPEAYVLFDASNRITAVNGGFTELFGYSPEEVTGKDLDSVVADYPGINAEARELSAKTFSGARISAEGLRVRKDGSLFHAEILGSVFPGSDHDVSGFCIYRDATKRKKEEAEMVMNMKRESVIASVSARLLGGGAGGVPGALTELASFLGVKSGALLEMDGDGTPAREFLLAGGEVKEQSPPVFSSVRPEGLRELTRKLWEKNALLIDPEDAQESFGSMIFGAAGFPRSPAYIRLVYQGRDKNAFLLLQKTGKAMSNPDNDLVAMFCALCGSTLQREGRMAAMKEAGKRLDKASRGIVEILARALAMKDPFTVGHQINVANLARAMAERGGCDEAFRERVYFAGLVHDLGKIAVPSSILSKPGRLTGVEFEIIKEHVRHGWGILSSVELPWSLAEIVLQHHERLDGSGYPGGLRGKAIGKEARFLSVADVVEAMISNRPYRPGLGADEALAEVRRFRGIRFDREAVDLCAAVIADGFEVNGMSYLPYLALVSPGDGFTV